MNQIIRGRRAITPDTALRLGRLFGTTTDMWLNLQLKTDLYYALHGPGASDIQAIQPVKYKKAS